MSALVFGWSPARAADSKSPPEEEGTEEAAPAVATPLRSNRMEFDDRLVKGQTAQSGAVVLFERAPRELPPLVPVRASWRARIVEPVLGPMDAPAVEVLELAPAEPVIEEPPPVKKSTRRKRK